MFATLKTDGYPNFTWKLSVFLKYNTARVHQKDEIINAVSGADQNVLWESCGTREFLYVTARATRKHH